MRNAECRVYLAFQIAEQQPNFSLKINHMLPSRMTARIISRKISVYSLCKRLSGGLRDPALIVANIDIISKRHVVIRLHRQRNLVTGMPLRQYCHLLRQLIQQLESPPIFSTFLLAILSSDFLPDIAVAASARAFRVAVDRLPELVVAGVEMAAFAQAIAQGAEHVTVIADAVNSRDFGCARPAAR